MTEACWKLMMRIMYKSAHKMHGDFFNPFISSPMADPGCALNASGTLKSADDIKWYNDMDNDTPMETFSIAAPIVLLLQAQPCLFLKGTLMVLWA